ncbi:MAG: hypothetical protein U0893_19055 [Chloroflexota bacterium]
MGLLVLLLALPARQAAWAQTPPVARADVPLRNWYFAEGNGRHEFQTFFTILNLAAQSASVTVAYQRDDGIRLTQWLGVEPNARLSFNANDVVGPRAFGATFSADQDVVVERSNTWGPGQNAETTPGFAPKSMRDWYFAEGTTRGHVATYFVSQNLADAPATVNALFTRDDGSTRTRSFTLAPRARDAFRMNDLLPDTAFSAKFSADQDIMMERTIMLETDRPTAPPRARTGDARRLNGDAGGGVNPGANAIGLFGGLGYTPAGTVVGARDWRFAEGSTRRPYATFFVLFNPSAAPASVTLQYALPDGSAPSQSVRLAPLGRLALSPGDLAPGTDFGTAITADQPIVVERSYTSTGDGLYGALGFTPAPARTDSKSWYFAEGATTGGNELYFVLYNLTDRPAQVRATFFGDDGRTQERVLGVAGNGRLSVRANDLVPDRTFSSRFLSDQDIVVERTRYFSGQSGFTTLGAGVGR